MHKLVNKRIFWGLLILAAMVAGLIVRLAYVQLVLKNQPVGGTKYSMAAMAEIQSERETVLDSGRGRLYDRNGQPLAGETIWTAALFPQEESILGTHKDEDVPEEELRLHRLAEILGVSYSKLQSARNGLKEPLLWPSGQGPAPLALTPRQAREVEELKLDGIRVLPFARRYSGAAGGRQWLGYLSEATGEALKQSPTGLRIPRTGTDGLEKTLEPLLQGVGHTEAAVQVDARGNRVPGSPITVKAPGNPYYPLALYTTVDGKLQDSIEQLAAEAGIKQGAVVVLDSRNGDIAAMVSLPFYNPEQISPQGGEWNNRALQAAVPGSIFKIVTAAAALEAGVTSPEEAFYCTGEYGKYGLTCRDGKGHGALTMAEGFAVSCNTVFAALAERLSGAQLQAAALALGLGRNVGWQAENTLGQPLLRPLAGEQAGTIFSTLLPDDGGARVQTAIGQRDVQITPLQAANLVVTLLHGGEVRAPRILQRVAFASGQTLQELPGHLAPAPQGRISKATARILLTMMRKVVTEGTGSLLKQSGWPLAGKSGTAQILVNGVARNNQWFIGYGPVENPRYAVSVAVENVSPGSPQAATKLFGQVFELLSEASPGA
ncbi:penicillin-binding transpeptidase domain-containing protein [Paenibacillus sp. MMS20-IR301]|uniref:peptidoglycan D,D-transpeptidase FtsI family protein n=1 Tax=Paenibacillus sp. MMS20-IR301 TaxID=2895946 RepID=UPI0028EBA716|nr:penicillin-binding transpeptidase domain-containing protein [Paenibacillus sp. MMS20-IR301]WNS46629.1 penicillin-binding transpeptidase domain-containing protein [Paenibacillus sp. MMS20-IR301]